MRRLKLIFVHTPKSGGTSIRAAVTEFFSHDLVLADYGDRPNDPISPMNIDPYGFLDRCRQQNALTLANKAAVNRESLVNDGYFVLGLYRSAYGRGCFARAVSPSAGLCLVSVARPRGSAKVV
jgi:hypothetical protein